jgi:hypothetical protein
MQHVGERPGKVVVNEICPPDEPVVDAERLQRHAARRQLQVALRPVDPCFLATDDALVRVLAQTEHAAFYAEVPGVQTDLTDDLLEAALRIREIGSVDV